MNHGYCKNSFWHKWGHCFMQGVETKDNAYCPDYYNRKATNEKLEQSINRWIAQKQLSVLELNNIISRYNNTKQKGE